MYTNADRQHHEEFQTLFGVRQPDEFESDIREIEPVGSFASLDDALIEAMQYANEEA